MLGIADLGLLGLGLLLLVKGADFLVDSASRIAKRFGVSDFIIGLTIVAVGTSIPELAAAISASLEGETGFIVGNVIGANLSNICLVLGMTGLFSVIRSTNTGLKRDGFIMLAVFLLLYLFIILGKLGMLGGILFIAIFAAYLAFLSRAKDDLGTEGEFHGFVRFFVKFEYVRVITGQIRSAKIAFEPKRFKGRPSMARRQHVKDAALVVLGIAMVIVGAELLIDGAVSIATDLHVGSGVIGLTIVSLGTTLPEITVSVNAARKRIEGLALGNTMGSCVTNVLLVLGVSSLIRPLPFDWTTAAFTAPFMIMAASALLVMLYRGHIGRRGGAFLVGLYGLFMFLLIGLFSQ